ncbi:MAG: AAA family ATPase [Nitrospiraceae bacterium]|nr:AAA family ATPase [Nitrospiraceae bacterium]
MDYLQHYNLKEHPFSNIVDNRFYYKGSQHSEALVKLKYAITSKKGLAVVIGDIGTGKTTLARRLLDELDEQTYEAVLLVVVHSAVSADWLLKKLAIQLGVDDAKEDKIEILSRIYKRLIEIGEDSKTVVIIMDEVQMLNSKEIMEEFRGLLNMEMPQGKMVNFIFFGLPELDNVLALDEPLRQRVAVRIKLESLSEEGTREYILHRLQVAGSLRNPFTSGALKLIYQYSKGVPRIINAICDNALLDGYLFKTVSIDEKIINAVAVDLGIVNK